MTRTDLPRRLAASAGVAVVLVAGASTGLVVAEIEGALPVSAAPVAEPQVVLRPAPAPSATPAEAPHTITRAS